MVRFTSGAWPDACPEKQGKNGAHLVVSALKNGGKPAKSPGMDRQSRNNVLDLIHDDHSPIQVSMKPQSQLPGISGLLK
jgi:hypothetical protein